MGLLKIMWWCAIQCRGESTTRIIESNKIKEFLPTNKFDFEKKLWYELVENWNDAEDEKEKADSTAKSETLVKIIFLGGMYFIMKYLTKKKKKKN